jgi:hypothetical protein
MYVLTLKLFHVVYTNNLIVIQMNEDLIWHFFHKNEHYLKLLQTK